MPNFEIWVRFYFNFQVKTIVLQKTWFWSQMVYMQVRIEKWSNQCFSSFIQKHSSLKSTKQCNFEKLHYLLQTLKLTFFEVQTFSLAFDVSYNQLYPHLICYCTISPFLSHVEKGFFLKEWIDNAIGNVKMLFITHRKQIKKRKYLPTKNQIATHF